MTDAALDITVYADAIPVSLDQGYPDLVSNVVFGRGSELGEGYFMVYFKPGTHPYVETPDHRTVYFPHFPDAGHSVSSAQPGDFLWNVAELARRPCEVVPVAIPSSWNRNLCRKSIASHSALTQANPGGIFCPDLDTPRRAPYTVI